MGPAGGVAYLSGGRRTGSTAHCTVLWGAEGHAVCLVSRIINIYQTLLTTDNRAQLQLRRSGLTSSLALAGRPL